MQLFVAIPAAVAAGACFAVGGALQQRVASQRPEGESLSFRLLGELARQKMWLLGIGLAVVSYGFQGLALGFGPLSLVQPLIVTELIFALPLSAYLNDVRLGWHSWLGAAIVGGGLAVAIIAANPREGDPIASNLGWLVALGAVAVAAGAALLIGRQADAGPVRASTFAFSGALIMGFQSALFDNTIEHIGQGFVALFTAWQTYLLVIASIGGLLLIQSAYQAGPLTASMPVIDSTELVVAVAIGVTLFNEPLPDGLLRQTVTAIALAVVIVGIIVLDTSPATQRLHESEQEDQEETEEQEERERTG